MQHLMENEAKYIHKYKRLLYNCTHNGVHLDRHKQFEILYALLWNHLLWEDLPPDFGDTYRLPHIRDYGIDTVGRNYDQTGQVKHYCATSCIKWKDITNFTSYSQNILDISNMRLGTTPVAHMDSMTELLCTKINVVVHRNTFEDLLQTVLADYQPPPDLVHQPPTSIEPRRYLLDAYNEISTSTKTHLKLQLPCGTGKSYIMLYTMLEYLKQDASHTFCVFCPWVDVAKQLRDLFKTYMNVLFIGDGTHGRPKAKDDASHHCPVVVCVTPSVKHVPVHQPYTLKFYDEAHHLEDEFKTYRTQLDAVPSTKTLLFSATFHESDTLDLKLSYAGSD
jgi:hypothetical protein